MCYCPTPTLHLNLALTGDGAFLFSLKKTHSVWFISVLNYGDTENVLINHLLLVIPMSYPCHYTNLCPHKPHKHAHTHTHTHTHTHARTRAHTQARTHAHTQGQSLSLLLWAHVDCPLSCRCIYVSQIRFFSRINWDTLQQPFKWVMWNKWKKRDTHKHTYFINQPWQQQ